MYKIYITKSDYSEWFWYDDSNLLLVNEKDILVNPLEYKLFNNDVIDKDKNLVFSQIRTDKYIAGILLLSGKTYGRNKSGKLKYKCVPNDPKLPKFLIPYDIKNTGFNGYLMHPGPMNIYAEITRNVANGKNSLVLKQVENGLYLRTALLSLML